MVNGAQEPALEQKLVRSVVILGGGTAGWMTAAALAKALDRKVAITVVESDEIGTVGVGEATIPLIKHFNRHLEIDESEFMRETQGTYKLGIEFVGWGHEDERYMHGFGSIRRDVGPPGFEHLWLKMYLRGRAHDLEEYSITRRAARAGKFMHPRPDVPESPLSDLDYAYHFDASLYAKYLRRYAEKRGVQRVEGLVVDVGRHPVSGLLCNLKLSSGQEIEGQFFVDCSGFGGRLIEQVLHAGYEDWSHWLPCDRAVAVPCAGTKPLLPCTRSTARMAGWQWRIPLQHRTGNGYVFCSKHLSEDEATHTLLSHLDGEVLAPPRTLRFLTGMRRKSWDRNCVAIGLSSGFLEPLESTSIHLIQTAIARVVDMFPSTEFSEEDIDEYNRQTCREFEHVRDFIILHYLANRRRAGPLWTKCREMPIPDSLRRRISLFQSHGRLQSEPAELFAQMNWLQVLHGQGIRARGYHPLVDLANADDVDAYLEGLRSTIERCLDAMPTHEAFLEAHCQAPKLAGLH